METIIIIVLVIIVLAAVGYIFFTYTSGGTAGLTAANNTSSIGIQKAFNATTSGGVKKPWE